MSNPAVIKLAMGKVGNSKVWLDDNYGESIHLHIDDYRVDLSVQEFSTLYSDICEIINSLVNVEGLDVRDIDPVYLSLFLWKDLSKIESAKIDYVWLEDMLAPNNSDHRIYKLSESVGVRALQGNPKISEGYRKSHHLFQSEKERMSIILDSIRTNGYPYKGQYIIVYGEDNIIRDGQHRASCLYYLNGNQKVPVLRLGIKNYKSPRIHGFYNSFVFVKFRAVKSFIKKISVLLRRVVKNFRAIILR